MFRIALCFSLMFSTPSFADSSELIQSILGRALGNSNITDAHIYADGTLDGVFNGISYAGVWSLEDGRFCREITRGLKNERSCLELSGIIDDAGELTAIDFISQTNVQRLFIE